MTADSAALQYRPHGGLCKAPQPATAARDDGAAPEGTGVHKKAACKSLNLLTSPFEPLLELFLSTHCERTCEELSDAYETNMVGCLKSVKTRTFSCEHFWVLGDEKREEASPPVELESNAQSGSLSHRHQLKNIVNWFAMAKLQSLLSGLTCLRRACTRKTVELLRVGSIFPDRTGSASQLEQKKMRNNFGFQGSRKCFFKAVTFLQSILKTKKYLSAHGVCRTRPSAHDHVVLFSAGTCSMHGGSPIEPQKGCPPGDMGAIAMPVPEIGHPPLPESRPASID
jgi:hypothetical protein